MNTPRSAVAVLALTILSAGLTRAQDTVSAPPKPINNPYNLGTTKDGMTIVAPGTYGPFQAPTCEAGAPSCSAAAAGDPATTNALLGIGKLQELQATQKNAAGAITVDPAKFADVKKSEDQMKASGIYKDIQRSADGTGAVITLPNGMISYSDYVRGFDTIPKKPEDVVKDPNAPEAMKIAAQKILDQKNPDKMQSLAADNKMFNNPSGGATTKTDTAGGSNGPAVTATNMGAGNNDHFDATDPNGGGNADPKQMGAWMASNGGLPGSGSSGGNGDVTPPGQRDPAGDQGEAAKLAAKSDVSSGHIDTSFVDVIVLKKNLDQSTGIHDLESSAGALSKGANSTDANDGVSGGKNSRGSTFFGR